MEFIAVFILFPLFSALLGWVEQLFSRNIFLIGLFNMVLWLTLTFIVFNRTFLVWAVLNMVIATLSAYLAGRRRRF